LRRPAARFHSAPESRFSFAGMRWISGARPFHRNTARAVIIFLLTCAAVLLATSPLSLAAHKCGVFAPVPPFTEFFTLAPIWPRVCDSNCGSTLLALFIECGRSEVPVSILSLQYELSTESLGATNPLRRENT
jgi:hypothetical protein